MKVDKKQHTHHTHFVLMIIFTMRVTFLDYLILMFFSLLDIRKRNIDLMVNERMET